MVNNNEIQRRIKEQEELICRIEQYKLNNIKYIAGIDSQYWKTLQNKEKAAVAYQIFDYNTGKVIEENVIEVDGPFFPYTKYGLLYYREAKCLNTAYQSMGVRPDVIVCDGNGWMHPRLMGEATQFGIINNIATIGIAKNEYRFEGLEKHEHKFVYKNRIVGEELMLNPKATKGAIVSTGNILTLKQSIEIVEYMQSLIVKANGIKTPTKNSLLTKGSDKLARDYQKRYFEQYGGVLIHN